MDMSVFNEELVDFLADKLLIGLTQEENSMILKEFETIDSGISRIMDIEGLDSVEPMTHCLDDFVFELREDTYEEGGNEEIDNLLANCDDYVDTEVKVPKVVN